MIKACLFMISWTYCPGINFIAYIDFNVSRSENSLLRRSRQTVYGLLLAGRIRNHFHEKTFVHSKQYLPHRPPCSWSILVSGSPHIPLRRCPRKQSPVESLRQLQQVNNFRIQSEGIYGQIRLQPALSGLMRLGHGGLCQRLSMLWTFGN